MKKLTGFVVTAGHLDIEWYQPMRSYRFWTVEAFEDLKTACNTRGDFVTYVLDGQVFPLEEYIEVVPEDENEIRRLIKEKKLCIGPFYTQFDEWLPSAEAMIRNCLYGKRRAEFYGGYMNAGYLPDNFGHPVQIPQILQGFGIDSLLFMRGFPEIAGGHPDEFLYQGIDGSKVLASHFREGYSGAFDIFSKKTDPIQPRQVPYYDSYLSFEWHRELADHDNPERIAKSMIANVKKIHKRYPSGIIPLIAGADHLPPQINIGNTVKTANEMQDEINFIMGSAEDYIQMVYENLQSPETYDMELIGSRYQHVLLGALSTRCYLKHAQFVGETLLERYAEPVTAIAAMYGYREKTKFLEEAWKYILINSAHDSIHGSSLDEVHTEMETRYAGVRQIASGVIHEALSHIGKHSKHWWLGRGKESFAKGILTYAPVFCDFPQPVEFWLQSGNTPVRIEREDGKEIFVQVLEREPVEINGRGEPRNAYFPEQLYRKVIFSDTFVQASVNSYGAFASGHYSVNDEIKAGDSFIENQHLKVEVDNALINIYDKQQNRWYHGLNLLTQEADAGDAWDFSPPWTPGEICLSSSSQFKSNLSEKGSVRSSLEITGSMSVPAFLEGDKRSMNRVDISVKFIITVYNLIKRVDVRLIINNTAKDHRIRLKISPYIKTDFIRSQGHLAILDRPVKRPEVTENWCQPASTLRPFREWLAVQNGSSGFAVAFKGMYDYETDMNSLTQSPDISVTLLRAIQFMGRINTMQRKGHASWAHETPGAQCPGVHEFEWSYIPYVSAADEKAPFLPIAQSFLFPPVAHVVRSVPENGNPYEAKPVYRWEEPNIQFSAFKKCMDSEGYILRIYENQGKAVTTHISLNGFARAWIADMNEQNKEELSIKDGMIKVPVGAYKVVTIKLL